ncbi:MAG: transcriptional regulator [Euryarchaeota archaeon]|nr:transcriptional regulator [Euryarchaeota archaeon]
MVEFLSRALGVLREAGFETSEPVPGPSSFDVVARRGDLLLLLKVQPNVDALAEPTSRETRFLAGRLSGRPLVVGRRTRSEVLIEGVVYRRHGIASMSLETLESFLLENEPPTAYAAPGGVYVEVDGPALRAARLRRNLSLGDLASALGVSRRTIQKYEEEGMSTTVDKALRLEEYLGEPLVRPVNPLLQSPPAEAEAPPPEPPGETDPGQQEVFRRLRELGFEVHATRQAPFQAVSETQKTTLLTGVSRDTPELPRRVRIVQSISQVAQTPAVFILRGRAPDHPIEQTTLVTQGELEEVNHPRELLDRIRGKR